MTASSQSYAAAVDKEDIVDPVFKADVLSCFESDRRAIPARWLYDFAGSQLFDAITSLPEYYPTRTETALLNDMMTEASGIIGAGRAVVEFGAGSITKTPILLNSLAPKAFVPIDISGPFLMSSAAKLKEEFAKLSIYPVEADFMYPVTMPSDISAVEKLGFFPGSTIGNMVPRTAVDLLRSMRATLGDSSMLMIGFDRKKDQAILLPAYDDAQGITADFNINLLHRINRELDGNIPVSEFQHMALWNDQENRVEMHLQCLCDIEFTILERSFTMKADETIHTENSHKYSIEEAQLLLRSAGWMPIQHWSDERDWFSVIIAEAQPERSAP